MEQGSTVHCFGVASTSGLERDARGDRSALRLAQQYPPELHESAHAECGQRIQASDPGDKMPASLLVDVQEGRRHEQILNITCNLRVTMQRYR